MSWVCAEHSWREQRSDTFFTECEFRVAERIKSAIAEEREACASLATEFCIGVHDDNCPACDAAIAIRARRAE